MDKKLRKMLEKVAELGCIRVFWGARKTCDQVDGRELCATCAIRVFLASVE